MSAQFNISSVLLTAAIAFALLHSAKAQSTNAAAQSTTSFSEVSTKITKEKKFSVSATLTQETNLEESSSSSDESATTLELSPSYRISSKAKIEALLAAEKSANGAQETKILNTTLYLKRDPIALGPNTNLSLTLQGLLPTEEEAREKSSLQGALGGSARATHKFKTFGKNSSASYAINSYKFIHQFDRNSSRDANLSYRFRHLANYDIDLNAKFSLSLGGYYQHAYTYQNVVREVYLLEQSLSYVVSENFSVALAHSTSGSLFEDNGKDWNLDFYNDRASTVGLSLTYVY